MKKNDRFKKFIATGLALIIFAAPSMYNPDNSEVKAAATDFRDAQLQPFSSDSIWNTAMGSGAKFDAANSTRMKNFMSGSSYINSNNGYGIAMNTAKATDPIRTVTFQGKTFTHRIPANATIVSGSDGNLNVIDGQYVYEYWLVDQKADGNYTASYGVKTDLLGSGIRGGIRAGQFSTNGGLIRKHELENLEIPHALVMALSAEQLKSGWVFPAISEDGGNNGYSGTIPMGSLFAIPPTVDIKSLGLSPEGLMLAKAMQDYGIYVGDRASQVTLYASNDVQRELPGQFNKLVSDFQKILRNELRYVTNSGANSIAGGGVRRQPTQPQASLSPATNPVKVPAAPAPAPVKPAEPVQEPVKTPVQEPVKEPVKEQPSESVKPQPEKAFKDVPSNHRFFKAIQAMKARFYIFGYSDRTYKPEASITRSHVAAIIERSSADLTPIRPAKEFKDVSKSHANHSSIQKLYRAGIIDGSNGKFNPSDKLTRAELAKMFVIAFDLKKKPESAIHFSDVSSNNWASEYIDILASNKVTVGSDGKFMATENLTRGQYAAFLARTINLK